MWGRTASFHRNEADRPRAADRPIPQAQRLDDRQEAPARIKQLATFLEDNRYPIGPEIVFWENESMLVKTGTNTEIKTWF